MTILWHWEWHPSTFAGVAVLAVLYAWLAGPVRVRTGSPAVPRWRIISFACSLILILVALNGPLHELSDTYLFSAHMVQHPLLLSFTVPPLFLAGVPGWMVDLVLRPAPVRAIARFLTRPLIAFGIASSVMAGWHFPFAYDLAMANHGVHIAMHLSMMVSAGIMWWPVLSNSTVLPRLSAPLQMIYLFALGIPMAAVGAFITLAQTPLYEWYVRAPRITALSPLEDQRVGGLLMWVPGMLLFWSWMTVIWFRWAGREEENEAVSLQPSAFRKADPPTEEPRC